MNLKSTKLINSEESFKNKALYWYDKTTNNGYEVAQCNLGWMNGDGVIKI